MIGDVIVSVHQVRIISVVIDMMVSMVNFHKDMIISMYIAIWVTT